MTETNPNARLEAFCDGVFAFALTLLIVDIKIPHVENASGFWLALQHIVPSVFAFLLSFAIILITWVNHHAALKLVDKTAPSFIYANGMLLLSVVFIPFPTSLLGEYLLSDHAAPAVILYNAVLVLQAIGWILICRAALKNNLGKSEKSTATIGDNLKFGYFAFTLYALCAIAAFWFPLAIAIFTTISWVFWLIWGITLKHE